MSSRIDERRQLRTDCPQSHPRVLQTPTAGGLPFALATSRAPVRSSVSVLAARGRQLPWASFVSDRGIPGSRQPSNPPGPASALGLQRTQGVIPDPGAASRLLWPRTSELPLARLKALTYESRRLTPVDRSAVGNPASIFTPWTAHLSAQHCTVSRACETRVEATGRNDIRQRYVSPNEGRSRRSPTCATQSTSMCHPGAHFRRHRRASTIRLSVSTRRDGVMPWSRTGGPAEPVRFDAGGRPPGRP